MRTQHQTGQARNLAFVATADISDRVELRLHPGIPHPRQNKIGRRAMLWREKDARQLTWRLGDRGQGIDAPDNFLTQGWRAESSGLRTHHGDPIDGAPSAR